MRKLSDTLVNMIGQMYSEGVPITKIAEELRLNRTTVHRYLEQLGLRTVNPQKKLQSNKRTTSKQVKEILRLYKEGVPVVKIEEKTGFTQDTIYRYVRREKLDRQIPESTDNQIIELYSKQKMNVKQIAAITEVSVSTVYRRIRQHKEGR